MTKAAVIGMVKDGKSNISKKYYEHIQRSGIIPITAYPKNAQKLADECNYLVVCGGGDIHPKFYMQEQMYKDHHYDTEFDKYELEMINIFLSHSKPILGICRGMQSINVALGGTLIQDIPSQLGLYHQTTDNNICMHEIKISKNSHLYNSFGMRAIVNSYHHQCVHKLSDNLIVAAASHDGVIEAIEGIELPILGVQWHPERMAGNTVFDHFFNTYK